MRKRQLDIAFYFEDFDDLGGGMKVAAKIIVREIARHAVAPGRGQIKQIRVRDIGALRERAFGQITLPGHGDGLVGCHKTHMRSRLGVGLKKLPRDAVAEENDAYVVALFIDALDCHLHFRPEPAAMIGAVKIDADRAVQRQACQEKAGHEADRDAAESGEFSALRIFRPSARCGGVLRKIGFSMPMVIMVVWTARPCF